MPVYIYCLECGAPKRWSKYSTLAHFIEWPNSKNSFVIICKQSVTLKQTQSEKGNVTMTMSHENAVRSQPQTPIPTSESPAEKQTNEQRLIP